MRVGVIQCIGTVLKKSRPVGGPAWASLAFCILAFPASFASGQGAVAVVSAAEQATRDDVRLRVLETELRKSEDRLEFLAKRRAERLAVGDQLAAHEADEERVRTLSDIAGLRREIGTARTAAGQPRMTPAASLSPTKTRPVKLEPNPPWWDVYGKVRRTDAASSASALPPQNAAAVQSSSIRRME